MTITIQKITMREIRMMLREPFQISSGSTSTRRIMLLELEDADGVTSWSECVAGETPNYSPETIATCWIAIDEWIGPKVLGKEFSHPGDLKKELDTDIRGHNMAKAAVEMGAWALESERQSKSLSHLLGGTRDTIGTGISLGDMIFDCAYQFRYGNDAGGDVFNLPSTSADVTQHLFLASIIYHF